MRHEYFATALPGAGDDVAVRLHYTEWGDPGNPRVLACAHGLTRNARDFDYLARALAGELRVACLDFPGRGASDWLADSALYSIPVYAALGAAWLARLGGGETHWLGTSMGGLVGLCLAAQPGHGLRSMLLNDVGPEVPAEALRRIGDYLGTEYRFGSLQALETHLRLVHAPFGPLEDAHWRHLAEHSHRRLDDGGFTFHYDPRIAAAFQAAGEQGVDLWPQWRALDVPTLLLQGRESDVLPPALAERMLQERPGCELHSFAGVGHAPALMIEEQIEVVRAWLARYR